MINPLKLMKLAKSALTPDELGELAAGLGWDVSYDEVSEDGKADAFQRVAQSSLSPGAQVVLVTVTVPMQGKMEGLLVLRPSLKGNVPAGEQTVDAGNGIPLSLPQSA